MRDEALAGQTEFAQFCQNIVDYLNRSIEEMTETGVLLTSNNEKLITVDNMKLTVAGG